MENNAEKCFKIRLWVNSQHCLFYFSMCLILFVIKEDREREREGMHVCACATGLPNIHVRQRL